MIPNYKKIFEDLITEQYPEKLQDDDLIHDVNNIRYAHDIIKINDHIFENSFTNIRDNQKLKSYDQDTILKILKYQQKHNFSNSHIAVKYKMSRNTISKWRRIYKDRLDSL